MRQLTYFANNSGLRWTIDKKSVEKRFSTPVKAVQLNDGSGLLVVEPASDEAPNNAIILNVDGSLRTRIKNPESSNAAICFADAYYVRDELTLVIAFSSWQMGCVIDVDGNVIRTYEMR
jgi:hypothetical protein